MSIYCDQSAGCYPPHTPSTCHSTRGWNDLAVITCRLAGCCRCLGKCWAAEHWPYGLAWTTCGRITLRFLFLGVQVGRLYLPPNESRQARKPFHVQQVLVIFITCSSPLIAGHLGASHTWHASDSKQLSSVDTHTSFYPSAKTKTQKPQLCDIYYI